MSDTLFSPGTVYTSPWGNDVNLAVYNTLLAPAGTANAITATGPQQVVNGYNSQMKFFLTPASTNTGAATLNLQPQGGSFLGAKAITKGGGVPLVAGDLVAGCVAELVYDGVEFQLINPQTSALLPGGVLPIANGGTGATTAAAALTALGAIGRLLNIQYLTASGTYTPTAGTNKILLEGVGGGGGSAGCAAASAGTNTAGGAGGSGTWGRKLITSGFTGTAYTIGAAGAAGTPGANAGGLGGSTTFGAVLTLPGGPGGLAASIAGGPAILLPPGSQAAAATGADISVKGQGSPGVGFGLTGGTNTMGNAGGSNPLGQGASPAYLVTAGSVGGNAGTGYGSGASGPISQGAGSIAVAGIVGQPGILIVYEFS